MIEAKKKECSLDNTEEPVSKAKTGVSNKTKLTEEHLMATKGS